MTPRELYARAPVSTTSDLGALRGFYYDHVPEVSGDLVAEDPAVRVVVRVYKHFDFDHRRFWRLASVWFDGAPVMIVQNAGREGDDHRERFITNSTAYHAMIDHLQTLTKPAHQTSGGAVVDPDIDVPALDEFYGNKLDGYFEKARY